MSTKYGDPYAAQKKKNPKSGRSEMLKGYTVGSLAPSIAVKSGSTIADVGTTYGAPTPPAPLPLSRPLNRSPSHLPPHAASLGCNAKLTPITISRHFVAISCSALPRAYPAPGISKRFGGKINGRKVSEMDEAQKDNSAAVIFSALSIFLLLFGNSPQ